MTSISPAESYDYQDGGPLGIDVSTYVKRRADDKLYGALKARNFCYVLNARQMGKSSLKLRVISQLQEENITCASITLESIGTSVTEEEWYTGIIQGIVRSLRLRQFDLDRWWTEQRLLSKAKRFELFLETVLLATIAQPIVIFVDEIDMTRSLPFQVDDFFGILRNCYNSRAYNSDYRRLTFVLIGVATPYDLIQNKQLPPFNIGQPIDLTGFQLEESHPLLPGLALKTTNPQTLLKAVLHWTGGQPLLTQKVCKLSLAASSVPFVGRETEWVEELVRKSIIENWEAKDTHNHLSHIRDRLLHSEERRISSRLGLYQQILQQGELKADDSLEQMDLRLTGLVVKRDGKLRIYNPIYAEIFNQDWLNKALADLRPYAEAITLWLASDPKEESWLLRGRALREALVWKAGRSLSPQDDGFLDASQQEERQAIQLELETEEEARRILEDANRRAEQRAVEAKEEAESIMARARKRRALIIAGAVALGILSLIFAHSQTIVAKNAIDDAIDAEGRRDKAEKAQRKAEKQLEAADKRLITADQTLERKSSELDGANQKVRTALGQAQLANQKQKLAQLSVDAARREQKQALDDRRQARIARNQALAEKRKAEQQRDFTQVATKLEQESSRILRDFETVFISGSDSVPESRMGQLEKLISAIQTGQKLREITNGLPPQEYYAFGPKFTLQQILYNISEKNQFQHKARVFNASFSSNGLDVLTCSDDGTAVLWNRNGKKIETFSHNGSNVLSATLSQDGKFIFTGTNKGEATLWSRNGNKIKTFSPDGTGSVRSVNFNYRGDQILIGSDDGVARLWSTTDTTKPLQEYRHSHPVLSVSFDPINQQILTTSGNNAILWHQNGIKVRTFSHKSSDLVNSASFRYDGRQIVTASSDKTAAIWDVNNNQPVQIFTHESEVQIARFSPNQKYLLTGLWSGRVVLWDIQEQKELQYFEHDKVAQNSSDLRPVYDVNFSPNGQEILVGSGTSKAVLWNLSNLIDSRAEVLTQFHHQAPVSSVSFSPDGRRVITASSDKTAVLWNRNTNRVVQLSDGKPTTHDNYVTSVSFNRDGSKIVTGSYDRTVKLWSGSGSFLNKFEYSQPILDVSFSPTRDEIATGARDGVITLLNLDDDHKTIFRREENKNQVPVRSVKFSSKGDEILSGYTDGTVILWSRLGERIVTFQHQLADVEMSVNSVSFSPTGEQFLTSSDDHTAVVWNRDGSRAMSLEHDSEVNAASFSHDGQKILTSAGKGTITIWSRDGEKIHQFQQLHIVQSASFSSDGTQVLTGSDDNQVRLWRIYKIENLIQLGCNWLHDYMTHNPSINDTERVSCGITGQ